MNEEIDWIDCGRDGRLLFDEVNRLGYGCLVL
jgi:hypothetical protein